MKLRLPPAAATDIGTDFVWRVSESLALYHLLLFVLLHTLAKPCFDSRC